MSNVTGIRDKIKSKLSEMRTLKTVKVFGKAIDSTVGFPLATIKMSDGEGEFADTKTNLREHRFVVDVFIEKTEDGGFSDGQSEEVAIGALDEILTAFDQDTTLSGYVKYVQPARWTTDFEDREIETRVLRIELRAVELVASA